MIAAAFFARLLTWSSAKDKSHAFGVGVQGFVVPFVVALQSISRKLPATTTTTTAWSLLTLYNTDENTNAETNINQDANRDVHLEKGVNNNDEPGSETENPQASPPEKTISKATTTQEGEVIIMKMLEQMRIDMANEKVERAAERKALEVKMEALEAELANLEKTGKGTNTDARPIFDMKALVKTPLDVRLPDKPESPKFVCSQDWLNVEDTIMAQLEAKDTSYNRVPPMGFVRCSRGGKTRALTEIAHILRKAKSASDSVAVIFVSFNDKTSLSEKEEEGPPLQALLRRIAFAACRHQGRHKFSEFRDRGEYFDEFLFDRWLGEGRIVLIIDELNALPALTDKKRRSETRRFGDFLKQHFLTDKGRYLLFSSHVLSTIDCFSEFIDPSTGSARGVLLQELPLITNVEADFGNLEASSLNGARAAIYFGLIPAMIYEEACGNLIEGKRDIVLEGLLESV